MGLARDLIVECDGREVARLRDGCSTEVVVADGEYSFVASMDWVRSVPTKWLLLGTSGLSSSPPSMARGCWRK